MNHRHAWTLVMLMILSAGCATKGKSPLVSRADSIVLLNPELELGEHWQHRRLRKADTTYTRVESELGHTIKAQGNISASILFRDFEPININCSQLSWSWYVAEPQTGADLHIKGRDDVAASVFVAFGDAGVLFDKPVPMLRYVWSNKQHLKGEIIVGPYLRKYLRTIVVRTGSPLDRQLQTDSVNLREDYRKAFGRSTDDGIYAIAIFTDNDDTGESVVAHYGKIELLCNE